MHARCAALPAAPPAWCCRGDGASSWPPCGVRLDTVHPAGVGAASAAAAVAAAGRGGPHQWHDARPSERPPSFFFFFIVTRSSSYAPRISVWTRGQPPTTVAVASREGCVVGVRDRVRDAARSAPPPHTPSFGSHHRRRVATTRGVLSTRPPSPRTQEQLAPVGQSGGGAGGRRMWGFDAPVARESPVDGPRRTEQDYPVCALARPRVARGWRGNPPSCLCARFTSGDGRCGAMGAAVLCGRGPLCYDSSHRVYMARSDRSSAHTLGDGQQQASLPVAQMPPRRNTPPWSCCFLVTKEGGVPCASLPQIHWDKGRRWPNSLRAATERSVYHRFRTAPSHARTMDGIADARAPSPAADCGNWAMLNRQSTALIKKQRATAHPWLGVAGQRQSRQPRALPAVVPSRAARRQPGVGLGGPGPACQPAVRTSRWDQSVEH